MNRRTWVRIRLGLLIILTELKIDVFIPNCLFFAIILIHCVIYHNQVNFCWFERLFQGFVSHLSLIDMILYLTKHVQPAIHVAGYLKIPISKCSLRETFVCAERKLICNKIFTNDHKIRWLDALPILINRESTCDILNK